MDTVYVAQPHDNSNYAQVFSTFDAAVAYVVIRTRRPADRTDGKYHAEWFYNFSGGETSWIVLRRTVFADSDAVVY